MRYQRLEGKAAPPSLDGANSIPDTTTTTTTYPTEREEPEAERFQTSPSTSDLTSSAAATLSEFDTTTDAHFEKNFLSIDLGSNTRHNFRPGHEDDYTTDVPPLSSTVSVVSSARGANDELAAKANTRRLQIAIALCSVFFAVELVGGLVAGSLAILSDSFHLLSDCVSFCISLMAIKLSRRKSTKDKTYGYHRAEVIGALISVFLIWGLTLNLCVEAIGRLTNPQPVEGKIMLVIAICGVCVNVILGVSLHHDHLGHSHGHCHSHNHSHSHSGHPQKHTHEKEPENMQISNDTMNEENIELAYRRESQCDLLSDDETAIAEKVHAMDNINVRAATLHVLGDLISSIGVLIASIIIMMGGPPAVDPICTFLFSAMVIMTTVGVAKESIGVLMEATPSSVDAQGLARDLSRIDGVDSVHALHVWELTPGKVAMSVHIVQNPTCLVSKPHTACSPSSAAILPMPSSYLYTKTAILSRARTIAQRHGCGERFCTIQVEVLGEDMCGESEGWEMHI